MSPLLKKQRQQAEHRDVDAEFGQGRVAEKPRKSHPVQQRAEQQEDQQRHCGIGNDGRNQHAIDDELAIGMGHGNLLSIDRGAGGAVAKAMLASTRAAQAGSADTPYWRPGWRSPSAAASIRAPSRRARVFRAAAAAPASGPGTNLSSSAWHWRSAAARSEQCIISLT